MYFRIFIGGCDAAANGLIGDGCRGRLMIGGARKRLGSIFSLKLVCVVGSDNRVILHIAECKQRYTARRATERGVRGRSKRGKCVLRQHA